MDVVTAQDIWGKNDLSMGAGDEVLLVRAYIIRGGKPVGSRYTYVDMPHVSTNERTNKPSYMPVCLTNQQPTDHPFIFPS